MYRLTIETIDPLDDEASISVDKILDEDGVRHVLVSMMQFENYKANLSAFARQREKERENRPDGDAKP